MGRKQINFEALTVRLPKDTLTRIAAALKPNEPRAAFIRKAISRELSRRERSPEKKG